jgi:AsmA protein
MSKVKKIVLIAVVALVVIVLGAAIIIPLIFDIDHYRPQVAAELQEKTGKPAQIGHLALTILPQVAIRVDDFSLGNPAGFPNGDFVRAKKIYAVVNAGALLHRKVEITSLELDDLTLNMLEDTHGKWNFENPPAKEATPPPPTTPAGSGASFTMGVISKLTITHGQFSAANLLASGAPGETLMAVHGATIDLRQVDLGAFTTASLRAPEPDKFDAWAAGFNTTVYAADAPGPMVAEGTIKADALAFGPINVSKLKSKFRLFPKQVFLDDLALQCYGGSTTGNLSLDFGGANLAYGVDAHIKGVHVAEFLAAFPQTKGMMTGTFDGSAKMKGLVTHAADPLVGVTGSGQATIRNGEMPSLQLNSNLRTMAKLTSLGPANGDPSSFSSLAADFHVADARLTSNKITLVGNGVDVDGSGSMTMAGDGSLDYQGEAGIAASGGNPLTSVLGGLAGAKVENGKLTFPFTVGGTFAKPKFSLKGGASGAAGAPTQAVQKNVDTVRGIVGMFKKKKQ